MIFVMVSWIYNNAKDVKTEIDNTLRVSLAFLVKLENNNEKDAMAQRTKVSECISPGFSIVPVKYNTISQLPVATLAHLINHWTVGDVCLLKLTSQ